jgi:hypothetical protein
MKHAAALLAALLLFWAAPMEMPRARAADPSKAFTVSIDRPMWDKWGFQYPVTYVFRVTEAGSEAKVERRDGPSGAWAALAPRRADVRFNGVEGVRWDATGGRAYVSVGFRTANTIELRFSGVGSAVYDSAARYYDNRKAAYTLSNDNWGRVATANPGAAWQGATNDASDKYQAAVHVCRGLGLPLSIAINSRMAGRATMWQRMQEELAHGDFGWEPAVHTHAHPCSVAAYRADGYPTQILGCRDEILKKLTTIPYGQHVFEYILPCGYHDDELAATAAGEFLFVRPYNGHDNPASTEYAAWNVKHRYYDGAGFETKSYDGVLERRRPKGRYYAADVALLNAAFDAVCLKGGIFYAMWHSDRYQNSVIHDTLPGADGTAGSTLIQHLTYVASRKDVWHVANGWLYSYRYVAENARVR